MTAPHKVDSTAHPTGEAALYAELCRLKAAARALLALLDRLPMNTATLRAAGPELETLRKEVGAP